MSDERRRVPVLYRTTLYVTVQPDGNYKFWPAFPDVPPAGTQGQPANEHDSRRLVQKYVLTGPDPMPLPQPLTGAGFAAWRKATTREYRNPPRKCVMSYPFLDCDRRQHEGPHVETIDWPEARAKQVAACITADNLKFTVRAGLIDGEPAIIVKIESAFGESIPLLYPSLEFVGPLMAPPEGVADPGLRHMTPWDVQVFTARPDAGAQIHAKAAGEFDKVELAPGGACEFFATKSTLRDIVVHLVSATASADHYRLAIVCNGKTVRTIDGHSFRAVFDNLHAMG
jgi:hypothetical protein